MSNQIWPGEHRTNATEEGSEDHTHIHTERMPMFSVRRTVRDGSHGVDELIDLTSGTGAAAIRREQVHCGHTEGHKEGIDREKPKRRTEAVQPWARVSLTIHMREARRPSVSNTVHTIRINLASLHESSDDTEAIPIVLEASPRALADPLRDVDTVGARQRLAHGKLAVTSDVMHVL